MSKKKNPVIVEVIRKCRELDFVRSEIPGGVVVEIPTLYQFQKGISEENIQELQGIYDSILHDLRENYNVGRKGRHMFYGRFRLWETGSFAKSFGAPNPVSKTTKKKSSLPLSERLESGDRVYNDMTKAFRVARSRKARGEALRKCPICCQSIPEDEFGRHRRTCNQPL